MNLSYLIKIFVQAIAVLTICLQSATMQAQFAGGNGTAASPYQISTAAQLDYLSRMVNSGNTSSDYNEKHYILMADIDLSGYNAANTNFNNGKGWIPIGISYAIPFNGTFDGNGKKIKGLYINSDKELIGLFGYLTGIVRNLALEEANITGGNLVGGLAGMFYSGIIANCYVAGDIKGIDEVGGLTGYICFGYIDNSYTLGTVSGRNYIGGLAGSSTNGRINKCAALNSSVEAFDGTSVRRITGFYAGSRTELDNIAFAGMTIKARGNLQAPITDDPNILFDGNSYTAEEIAVLKFSEMFRFATPDSDPWTYGAGKLPGFGAAADMPDYLIKR